MKNLTVAEAKKKLLRVRTEKDVRKILWRTSSEALRKLVKMIGIYDDTMLYYEKRDFVILLCGLYRMKVKTQEEKA